MKDWVCVGEKGAPNNNNDKMEWRIMEIGWSLWTLTIMSKQQGM